MNVLKMYKLYRNLMKNQWRDPRQIRIIQEKKLKYVINHAYNHVPYYRRIFDEAGVLPLDITSIGDMNLIPITTKADLQGFEIEGITSRAFRSQDIKTEHTSGSTGRPFTMYFDPDFIMARDALFLRALRTAGYRPGQKLLLITSIPTGKKKRRLPRWHYLSILQSPGEHLMYLNRFKPDMLYGCKTSLMLLARYIRDNNYLVHSPLKIVSTAELLDAPTRCLLEETFNAETYDFYGLTEMGIVGWECSEHNGYHFAEDSTIVEYQPVGNGNNLFKLVMTNLHLTAMPFIRFETGDVAIPDSNEPCPCGRKLSRLKKIEGRMLDCIQLKNGRIVSPYRLTCALEKLRGINSYQVIQKDYDKFTVKVESGIGSAVVADDKIQKIMHSVLGEGIRISVLRKKNIDSLPEGKFRVIKSEVQKESVHEDIMY